MIITVFAKRFVDSLSGNLQPGKLKDSSAKKLQNLIIMAGNSLIGDVTLENELLLRKKVIERIESTPLDGVNNDLINSTFERLKQELVEEKKSSKNP